MKTRIFNHIITTGTAMRIYSALEHTRYGCTVPGGYLEDPDPLRGGFLTVAVIIIILEPWFAHAPSAESRLGAHCQETPCC